MIATAEEGWLLIRRSLSDRDEMAFYFSDAPAETSVKTLARIALQRAEIEKCFSEAKTEAGMDEYEVRLWPAWYRHITLSMMAHAFLSATKKNFRPRNPAPVSPSCAMQFAWFCRAAQASKAPLFSWSG